MDEDCDSMSMSSLSFESDQHQAGLFEYVVKMRHMDRPARTSSEVPPVRFRSCAQPLTDPPPPPTMDTTPGATEGDVPPVILRPVNCVKQPEPEPEPESEPEPLVDDDTVPKEPATPTTPATLVVPSEATSEPKRDECVTQAELVKQSDGGESQPGEPTHHHQHSHKDKKHRKKKKDKSEKKRDRDGQSKKEERKLRHPSGDDGAIGRNMRAAPMHPALSVGGSTAARTEEDKHLQNKMLQERLRLAQRRQKQQRALQAMLLKCANSQSYNGEELKVKDGRRHDAERIKQLLDGSFPLACTTIGARRYSMARTISEPPDSARTHET